MARHGILVTSRELTSEELSYFELAPLVDGAAITSLAAQIANGPMSRYAKNYLSLVGEDEDQFRSTVLEKLSRIGDGVRYSVGSDDELIAAVKVELQNIVAAAKSGEKHKWFCLSANGEMHLIGQFENYDEASAAWSKREDAPIAVWTFDAAQAREYVMQLQAHL